MNKGLEALERIEKELAECYGSDIAYYPDTFDNFQTVRKYLMALEIVKKYHITAAFFTFNSTYKAYEVNMSFYEDEAIMSEGQYNLAKEILL